MHLRMARLFLPPAENIFCLIRRNPNIPRAEPGFGARTIEAGSFRIWRRGLGAAIGRERPAAFFRRAFSRPRRDISCGEKRFVKNNVNSHMDQDSPKSQIESLRAQIAEHGAAVPHRKRAGNFRRRFRHTCAQAAGVGGKISAVRRRVFADARCRKRPHGIFRVGRPHRADEEPRQRVQFRRARRVRLAPAQNLGSGRRVQILRGAESGRGGGFRRIRARKARAASHARRRREGRRHNAQRFRSAEPAGAPLGEEHSRTARNPRGGVHDARGV